MEPEPSSTNSDERILALLVHLLGIFTGFIGPLIVWMIKREERGFVEDQAREALNFQVTLLIGAGICMVLMFVVIGIFLIPLLGLCALVFPIIAAVKAHDGQRYRYPVTLRLIS